MLPQVDGVDQRDVVDVRPRLRRHPAPASPTAARMHRPEDIATQTARRISNASYKPHFSSVSRAVRERPRPHVRFRPQGSPATVAGPTDLRAEPKHTLTESVGQAARTVAPHRGSSELGPKQNADYRTNKRRRLIELRRQNGHEDSVRRPEEPQKWKLRAGAATPRGAGRRGGSAP